MFSLSFILVPTPAFSKSASKAGFSPVTLESTLKIAACIETVRVSCRILRTGVTKKTKGSWT